jgi:hypothetical protein
LLKQGELLMTILGGLSLVSPLPQLRSHMPKRLAIYYGYPSVANGAVGDVEKAARAFSTYDVVVFGDGVEFADQRPDRAPTGVGAEENQKARSIIAALARQRPAPKVFGYICLGDSQRLSESEIQRRVHLWKEMGVSGIFLDEAGYDWKIVDRERQNAAVAFIHSLGLSAFLNAFYPKDLFSRENLLGKNPEHAAPRLDGRDLFLLESFQVKNGAYEDVSEWQQRVEQAVDYRAQYRAGIFAITTNQENSPFNPLKFAYAWWSAWLYDLDGFGWGEPNFSVPDGILPARRCSPSETTVLDSQNRSIVHTDGVRFWKEVGNWLVVIDTADHSVRRTPLTASSPGKTVETQVKSLKPSQVLACGGIR